MDTVCNESTQIYTFFSELFSKGFTVKQNPFEKIMYFFKINQCFGVNAFENSTHKNEYFWKIKCVSKQYPFEKKQYLFENITMFHCKAL